MTVKEIIQTLAKKHLEVESVDDDTVIFGAESSLDSLGLVSFLSDIEQEIFEVHNKEIVIASEKAMSLNRSPFATVGLLTKFVEELL